MNEDRIVRFWKWCGVKPDVNYVIEPKFKEGSIWNKDKKVKNYPPLTLSNIRQYAVPKLDYFSVTKREGKHTNGRWICEIRYPISIAEGESEIEAVFGAIDRIT